MQYRTGKVTVVNGSNIVVGAGTNWATSFPGASIENALFAIPNQAGTYYVQGLDEDGNIVLTGDWNGPNLTTVGYWLTVDFSPIMGFPLPQPLDIEATKVIEKALLMIDQQLDLRPAGLYSVKSKSTTAPPASPSDGDAYIVPTGATGAWAAYAGKIAVYRRGAWLVFPPNNGMWLQVADVGSYYFWNASTSAWEINPIVASGVAQVTRDTAMDDGGLTYWDQTHNRIQTSGGMTMTALQAALAARLRVDAAQGLTSGQQTQGRANLGLVIGTDVQAHAARLDSIVSTGIDTSMFAANAVDNDALLNANSSTRLATQQAVKAYVDALIQGLKWKAPVACISTTNVASLSGEKTIDGFTTNNSRVLLTGQTTASNNGIWVSASGSWTRATDADAGSELINATTLVENGTVNGKTQWTCTNTAVTLGTTSITFAQVSAANITAGTNLNLTGSVLRVIDSPVFSGSVTAASFVGGSYTGSTFTGTGALTGTAIIPSGSTVPTNGMYLPAANALGWATNSTARMKLDANGKLLVGAGVFGAYTGALSRIGVYESNNTLAQNLPTDAISVTHNNNNDVGNQIDPAGFVIVRDKTSALATGDCLGGISWHGYFTQSGNTELRSGFASITAIANGANAAFLSFNPGLGSLTTARAMMLDSGGLLIKTSTRRSSEALTVGGDAYVNGSFLVLNDITTGHYLSNGTGGGSYSTTGFGTHTNYELGGIASTWGNPFLVYNNSNGSSGVGVQLIDGGNSWQSFSDETMKTEFEAFTDALNKAASIKVGIGRYLTDPEDKRRSFFSAQSLRLVLPEAVTESPRDKMYGEHYLHDPYYGKLLASPTDIIPLILAALKEAKELIEAQDGRIKILEAA